MCFGIWLPWKQSCAAGACALSIYSWLIYLHSFWLVHVFFENFLICYFHFSLQSQYSFAATAVCSSLVCLDLCRCISCAMCKRFDFVFYFSFNPLALFMPLHYICYGRFLLFTAGTLCMRLAEFCICKTHPPNCASFVPCFFFLHHVKTSFTSFFPYAWDFA